MTLSEYIVEKLAGYGYQAIEAEVEVMISSLNGDPASALDADGLKLASFVFYDLLPGILPASDHSEGQFSVKFDKAGLRNFYLGLCAELKLPSKLVNERPTAVNRSNIW